VWRGVTSTAWGRGLEKITMTTKMIDVESAEGPVQPDLSALAEQLVATARARGVELTGPGGLLTGLTRQVLETALETELGEPRGRGRVHRLL
jgi:putative transposase